MGTPQDLVAVEIMTSIAGPDVSWRPGQIVELPPEEAQRWCDGERARYLDAPPAEPVPAQPAADPGQQTATPVDAQPPANAAPAKKAAKAAKATARKR